MFRKLKPFVIAAALIAGTLLNGCTQSTLTAATSLSKAGQAAATQMEQNATLTSNQFAALQTAEIFHRNFVANRSPDNVAADKQIDQNLAELQKQLTARAKFLDSLSAAYAALGVLAGYDASGSFATAYAGLVTDANGLLTALKRTPIPSGTANDIQQIGGLIVGLVQQHQIIEASRKIRPVLEAVITAMADKTSEAQFIGLLTIASQETLVAASDLYSAHLYSVSPLIDRMGMPLGLTSASNVDQLVDKNPNVRSGMNAVLSARTANQTQIITANYEKSIAALQALLPLHDALEKGAPLDLTQISAIISELQSLSNALKQAKGS
jgi:hypothetical protein